MKKKIAECIGLQETKHEKPVGPTKDPYKFVRLILLFVVLSLTYIMGMKLLKKRYLFYFYCCNYILIFHLISNINYNYT